MAYGVVTTGKQVLVREPMKLIARELVEITRGIMGLEGRLKFDRTKPDGAPHKLIDISRLEVLESLDVCFT
ncbi:MAG: hypothetical protein ACJAS1_002787 [Oleiphilaceae bacterium]